jgi:minor curlin subunit
MLGDLPHAVARCAGLLLCAVGLVGAHVTHAQMIEQVDREDRAPTQTQQGAAVQNLAVSTDPGAVPSLAGFADRIWPGGASPVALAEAPGTAGSDAAVAQRGSGNDASVTQRGAGHTAVVVQRGTGITAEVVQRGGTGHTALLNQAASGHRVRVVQAGGDGNTYLLDAQAAPSGTVEGGFSHTVQQVGSDLTLVQEATAVPYSVRQEGTGMTMVIRHGTGGS